MRIGKFCNDLKTIQWDSVRPLWCKPFGLDSGSSFRALHVVNNCTSSTHDSSSINDYTDDMSPLDSLDHSMNATTRRNDFDSDSDLVVVEPTETMSSRKQRRGRAYLNPDWVYYIGIEIKPGKGLLKDTTFVYFSTRYYLVNKTSQDLLVSQYHFVRGAREKRMGLSWRASHNFNSNNNRSSSERSSPNESFYSTASAETRGEHANKIALLKDSMRQFHWPR